MKQYICYAASNDRKTRRLFLRLPSMLYGDDCPQDKATEKQLLRGKHPLSPDVEVFPFVVTDRSGNPLCRCLLTYYPGDPVAYVGFFEAFDDPDAVRELLRQVEQKALADGKTTLLGPIDVSIYIGYRFKTNLFDRTYTSEPYNKDYYPHLWQKCGFTICERYVSNQLRKVEAEDIDPRLKKIHDRYVSRGYEFVSPTKRNFEKCLSDVYESMMRLYTGFSGFKPLTKEQYLTLFAPLKRVLNFDMVMLVYKDGHLCAFSVAVPNYRHLTRGKRTLRKLRQMMQVKRNPDEYVVLYMGADPSASGLGGSLAHRLRNAFYERGCTSIGALIKEGQVTGKMYDCLYTDQFKYILLSKKVDTTEE